MAMSLTKTRCLGLAFLGWLALSNSVAVEEKAGAIKVQPKLGSRKDEPMVDVAQVCPTIVIELRYATARNVTGKAIYPAQARCLVRKSVAERLQRVQEELRTLKLRLKIWDAYRPAWAQQVLWDAIKNPDYVGEPARGGSLHTFGAGVDVTLVDARGRELKMPTDFDDFTPAASTRYRGTDPIIAANLQTLQRTMSRAGFWVLRDEWWHFVSEDVKSFAPIDIPLSPEEKAPVLPPAT